MKMKTKLIFFFCLLFCFQANAVEIFSGVSQRSISDPEFILSEDGSVEYRTPNKIYTAKFDPNKKPSERWQTSEKEINNRKFLPKTRKILKDKGNQLKFAIGITSLYTNTNDPNYTYTNQYDGIKNISGNVGLTYITNDKLVLGISTNRIYHPESERTVKNNAGIEFDNRSKLTADTFSVGYTYKRFIPSVFVSNVKSQESLYYYDRFIGSSEKTAFVYGANLTYFLTKEIAGSVFYVAPNKELNLEGGAGLGINYYFNLI